ncbi:RICIN domain-containing protein [Pseudomonas sp. MWU12-2037]|uniref:RICIN domain-containing protein n=1 Tax=Pseudomonas sp. MWU12-2037 TaxID=2928690 RepID=UPI00200C802E|nr:RICIN domain-containing protein [Pseudomonas sp. MWU12-2037]
MKRKSTPHQSEPSEQKNRGAPGSPVRIEAGLYKIYTALPSTPRKLVEMSLTQNSDLSYNVELFRDNNEAQSKWQIHLSAQGDLECLLINSKIFRALEAKGGNVIASIIPASDSKPGHGWFFKSAGREGGIDLFYIENRHTGNVMDVKESNTADGADIIEFNYVGTTNQKFILEKI